MRSILLRTGALVALIATALLAAPLGAGASIDDEFVMVFPQQHEDTSFVSDYGFAKPDGRRHRGVDLHSPKGTPVLAVADGVVVEMRTSPRAGHYLVIAHRDGWESWYLHLNNDRVVLDGVEITGPFADGLAIGSYVAAGDVIGYVGNSGNAEGTNPHTHFELHQRSRPVDPYPYLVAAQDRWVLESRIEAGETPFR